jgi:hypothetical protein
MIGQRTKEALAARKARGELCGLVLHKDPQAIIAARIKGAASNAVRAAEFAAKMIPTIKQLQAQGMSLDKVAEELTNRGEKTLNDKAWHKSTLSRLLKAAQTV